MSYGAEHRRSTFTRSDDRINQVSACSLAVGSRHPDESQTAGRMSVHRRGRPGEAHTSIANLYPRGRSALIRTLGYHCHRAALNDLWYELMGVVPLPANSDEYRSRRATARVMGDVDRFRIEVSGRRPRFYLICQIPELQFVLVVRAGSLSFSDCRLRSTTFESFTRQTASFGTSNPGAGD